MSTNEEFSKYEQREHRARMVRFALIPFVVMFLSYVVVIVIPGFYSVTKAEVAVTKDIAQEYNLNIEGIYKLRCIAGRWHYYKNPFSSEPYDPAVDCSQDRGMSARIKEKLEE